LSADPLTSVLPARSVARALLAEMRPRQWTKNLILFAPLLFSLELGRLVDVVRTVAAAVLFCLLSGGVYIVNDLHDLNRDRLHDTRRHRPLAAGQLSRRVAAVAAAVLLVVGLGGAVILGTGFALMCLTPRLRSFDLIPGVELVMQETGFDEHLAHADLVVTGEGQVDAQTAFGKTALGVARRAAAAGIPCLAVGGSVTTEGAAVMVAEGAVAVPVLDRPMTLDEAMNEVSSLVVAAGERLARIVEIGGAVALRGSRS